MDLLIGGDVFLNVADSAAALAPLQPLLRRADIVMANCEGVYSDRPQLAPSRKHAMLAARARGSGLGAFDVMSCANNHAVDGGYLGLADTLELLGAQGITVVGAGEDLAAAQRPAVLERSGQRVAFLAVCSVFPRGYEATDGRPGIAPLRIATDYREPDPSFWDPGRPARVSTRPFPEDRERLRAAIDEARALADVVVVACHWGSSGASETLHDYEIQLAREMVDWGADAVACCHHHSLRGIELHRGRPIFYGLGALVHHFDPGSFTPGEVAARLRRLGPEAFAEAMSFPLFPMAPAARMTGLATLRVDGDGVSAGFFPARIEADGSTVPLPADSSEAARIAGHLIGLGDREGFGSSLEPGERDGWACFSIV